MISFNLHLPCDPSTEWHMCRKIGLKSYHCNWSQLHTVSFPLFRKQNMADKRTCDIKAAISLFNTGIWNCVLQASSYVERLWSWVVYKRQNDREATSSFQNNEKVQGQYIDTGHNYCKSWSINLQAVVLFEDLERDGNCRFVYFRSGRRSQWSRKKRRKNYYTLYPSWACNVEASSYFK